MFKIIDDDKSITIEDMEFKYPNCIILYVENPSDGYLEMGTPIAISDIKDIGKLKDYEAIQNSKNISTSIAVSSEKNFTANIVG